MKDLGSYLDQVWHEGLGWLLSYPYLVWIYLSRWLSCQKQGPSDGSQQTDMELVYSCQLTLLDVKELAVNHIWCPFVCVDKLQNSHQCRQRLISLPWMACELCGKDSNSLPFHSFPNSLTWVCHTILSNHYLNFFHHSVTFSWALASHDYSAFLLYFTFKMMMTPISVFLCHAAR